MVEPPNRGFALVSALWAIVLASSLALAAAVVAREGAAVSANRSVLLRSGWARHACAQVVLARFSDRLEPHDADTLRLGSGLWCSYRIEDPNAKVDVNLADADVLGGLLANDTVLASLLDWRDADTVPRALGAEAGWYHARDRESPRDGPLADVEELALIRGADSALVARARNALTTESSGPINVNVASAEVLGAIGGLPDEAVAVILRRRAVGRPIGGIDELMSQLTSEGRRQFAADYQRLSAMLGYRSSRLVVTLEGGVGDRPPTIGGRLVAVPVPGRLAIVRQELE